MQILELAAKLQTVGFTDKQAKVYVAALFLGPSPVQKIAQQADVNRATAYVILDELMDMGVVSQSSEGKKTVFIAEGVDSIQLHLDSIKKDISDKQKELATLRSEIQSITRDSDSTTPKVFFFKGKEGIEQINKYYFKNTKKGSSSMVFTDREKVKEIIPKAFDEHRENRRKKKMSTKGIAYDISGQHRDDPKERKEVRLVDFRPAAEITIQEEFVMFATYNKNNHVSVVVESNEIAKSLRQLYELAWQSLPPEKDKSEPN